MADPQEPGDESRHFVRSAARVLEIIRAFDADHPRMTLSEVAAHVDLDRSTTRRFLLTLRDLGYVAQGRHDFALTPRILELGYAYLSGMPLVEVARPYVQQLADLLHETASLTVLDGDDVVYLDLASSGRITALRIKVGTRFPAHVTSMGRVLLAGLADTQLDAALKRLSTTSARGQQRTYDELRAEVFRAREQGWAIVDQELDDGLVGVAAPVTDRHGAVLAAINVSVHAVREPHTHVLESYVPALQDAAAAIARDYIPT